MPITPKRKTGCTFISRLLRKFFTTQPPMENFSDWQLGDNQHDDDNDKSKRDRPGKEWLDAVIGQQKCAPQVIVGQRAENDAKQERRCRVFEQAEKDAQHAEDEHQINVETFIVYDK